MTVLRHQAPAGATVTARHYSGNKYAPGTGTSLTAVADAQGWASLTLPDLGSRRAYWILTRPGASPVVIAIPSGAGMLTSTDVQLGTLDIGSDLVDTRPPAVQADLDAAHDTDVERESFIPTRLAPGALVPGGVYAANGALLTTKRLHVVLDTNGEVDDLLIEDVT